MFGHDETNSNDSVQDAPGSPVVGDSPTDSDTASVATPAPSTSDGDTPLPRAGGSDLLDIKQSALKQLTPLVGHLNQTPEEKFRTTMMMIQASDDQALVKDAYDAAQAISDEKTKAQALLDIINEINYFTQQNN